MAKKPAYLSNPGYGLLTKQQQKLVASAAGLAKGQRSTAQIAAMQAMRKAAKGQTGVPGMTTGGGGGPGDLTRPGDDDDYAASLPAAFRGLGSADIMGDQALLGQLLSAGGFTGSLDEQLRDALMARGISGIEQFHRNVGGTGGDALPSDLQDVGIAMDWVAAQHVVGEILDKLQRGIDPKADWAARAARIPSWARESFNKTVGSDVYGQLQAGRAAGSSLPWNLDFVWSPGINLTDPTKPFIQPGANPPSLIGLTGMQSGSSELPFLASMSAEEFYRSVQPFADAQYNRDPGSPAPFRSGLTMGSPFLNTETGTYERSPLMYSPEYQRMQAWGYPGFDPNAGDGGAWGFGNARGPVPAGALTPENFMQAASGWDWSGPWAQFAPGSVDPNFIARLLAMLGVAPNVEVGAEEEMF